MKNFPKLIMDLAQLKSWPFCFLVEIGNLYHTKDTSIHKGHNIYLMNNI